MPGETIPEEEYNRWLPFPVAYERVRNAIGHDHAKDEIRARIITGQLETASRTSLWDTPDGPPEERKFEKLSSLLWIKGGSVTNLASVWSTGTRIFSIEQDYQELMTVCNGIRLNPRQVDQILIDAGHAPSLPEEPEPSQSGAPSVTPVARGPTVSHADMEKVARLVHELWGLALTEARALEIAKAAFIGKHIPKDKFLPIYRSIRGHKMRGKQPLSE